MKKIAYFLLIALSLGFVACEHRGGADDFTITYKATQKLPQTQSDKKDGLHLNGFGAKCTGHVYDKATQTGTIFFATEPRTLNKAFCGCTDLISVDIPNSIVEIGEKAFYCCNNLTGIVLPDGLTEIGTHAFNHCDALTSINIPANVNKINSFAFNTCNSLATVTCRATTPPTIDGSSSFAGISFGAKLYVPSSAVDAYKADRNWTTFFRQDNILPIK